ncbi:MAG TPA: hypothetical protein VGE62_03105 [Candidatus Paceibacterota bacterium]
MKQATTAIRSIDRVSHVVFWFLAVSVVMLSFVYAFFIQKAIRNVVARDEVHAEIASLNSKLSAAEFKYINSVESVTLDKASLLGFTPTVDGQTTFITRETIGKNVAVR